MSKPTDQRVGVFVDVANMYHSAKNLYGANVSFSNVLKNAVDDRKLIRAFAYVIRSESEEEKAFFETLVKQGFEIRAKDLQVFAGGAKKGDWDVGLTVDAIRLADRLDTIVLVSGDGDYRPLVQYLQHNKGCRVEVMAFGPSASTSLREVADEFIDLTKDIKNLIRNRRFDPRRFYDRNR